MLDPHIPFQTALYNALTTPSITYNSTVVPVVQFTSGNLTVPTIFLSQVTVTPNSYLADCTSWNCSALVTVQTRFENAVSILPAATITNEVLERLLGATLDLGDEFTMLPIKVAMINDATEFKNVYDYLKYIRLQVRIQK